MPPGFSMTALTCCCNSHRGSYFRFVCYTLTHNCKVLCDGYSNSNIIVCSGTVLKVCNKTGICNKQIEFDSQIPQVTVFLISVKT